MSSPGVKRGHGHPFQYSLGSVWVNFVDQDQCTTTMPNHHHRLRLRFLAHPLIPVTQPTSYFSVPLGWQFSHPELFADPHHEKYISESL